MPLPIAINRWSSILLCYDFDQDTTLPAVEAMADRPPSLRLVRNDLGRGVAYARKGHQAEAEKDISTARILDPNIDREMAAIHIAAPAGI